MAPVSCRDCRSINRELLRVHGCWVELESLAQEQVNLIEAQDASLDQVWELTALLLEILQHPEHRQQISSRLRSAIQSFQYQHD